MDGPPKKRGPKRGGRFGGPKGKGRPKGPKSKGGGPPKGGGSPLGHGGGPGDPQVILRNSRILISGINAVGAEIAKTLGQQGCLAITLHDTAPATPADVSASPLLGVEPDSQGDDLGRNRAEAAVDALVHSNIKMNVETVTDPSLALVDVVAAGDFAAVVLVDSSLEDAVAVDAYCRSQTPPVKFVRADANGLAGRVFVDNGPGFESQNTSGEKPRKFVVGDVTSAGATTLIHGSREFGDAGKHWGAVNGCTVAVSEARGMLGLNGDAVEVVGVPDEWTLEVAIDSTGLPPYAGGGVVTEVISPTPFSYQSLSEFVASDGEPVVAGIDGAQPAAADVHRLYAAVDAFRANHGGALPAPGAADAAAEIAADAVGVEAAIARAFAHGSSAVISPMATLVGGVVAQEVIKGLTHKLSPLVGGLCVSAFEALPTGVDVVSDDNYNPADPSAGAAPNVTVFGTAAVEAAAAAKSVFVGAGSLGSELLKVLAATGVGLAANGGSYELWDGSKIEAQGDLRRSALFRQHQLTHRGVNKAKAAAEMLPTIHPGVAVSAVAKPVTDGGDAGDWVERWGGADLVVVTTEKPETRALCAAILEGACPGSTVLVSDTFKTNGFVEVTPTVSASPGLPSVCGPPPDNDGGFDPDSPLWASDVAVWARDAFQSIFTKGSEDATAFRANADAYLAACADADRDVLGTGRNDGNPGVAFIVSRRDNEGLSDWHQHVWWARDLLHYLVCQLPAEAQARFPRGADPDHYRGARRWAEPLAVDLATDPVCLEFIMAAAVLRAASLRQEFDVVPSAVELSGDGEAEFEAGIASVAAVLADHVPPTADATNPVSMDEAAAAAAECGLPAFHPVALDLRDQFNRHLDFIHALTRLRARVYGLPPLSRLRTRFTIGSVRASSASSRAVVAGLGAIEAWKRFTQGTTADHGAAARHARVSLGVPRLAVVPI